MTPTVMEEQITSPPVTMRRVLVDASVYPTPAPCSVMEVMKMANVLPPATGVRKSAVIVTVGVELPIPMPVPPIGASFVVTVGRTVLPSVAKRETVEPARRPRPRRVRVQRRVLLTTGTSTETMAGVETRMTPAALIDVLLARTVLPKTPLNPVAFPKVP